MRRWESAVLLAAGWVSCAAQVKVQAHLDQDRHLAGEPVYLIWEYINTGRERALFQKDDFYCARPRIDAPSLKAAHPPVCPDLGSVTNCAAETGKIAGGAKYVAKYLLNDHFDLNQPGTYELTLQSPGEKSTFKLALDPASEADLKKAYGPYFTALKARQYLDKTEAVRVLAGSGARFAEAVLLQISADPRNDVYIQSLANAGLARLGTPGACARLAELAVHPELHHQQEAIEQLGRCNDPRYMTVLFQLAENTNLPSATRYLALMAAGEAGGEAAVDRLLTVASQAAPERVAALFALGRTGNQRAAKGIIDALGGLPEPARLAAFLSLTTLTHRESAQVREWQQWWISTQQKEIHAPRDCRGGVTPLPKAP